MAQTGPHMAFSEEFCEEDQAQTGIYMPFVEDFFQKCLHEQVDAPAEPWSTGGSTYRELLEVGAPAELRTQTWSMEGSSRREPLELHGGGGHGAFLPVPAGGPLALRLPGLEPGTAGLAVGASRGLEAQNLPAVLGGDYVILCFSVRRASASPEQAAARPEEAEEPEAAGAPPAPSPSRRSRRRALRLVKAFSRAAPAQQDAKEACPICLEVPSCGQIVRTLPCFHMLHDACSARYFRTRGVNPTCPVCRCDVARAAECP